MKKMIALLLAVVMLAGLAACGEKAAEPATAPAENSAPAANSSTPAATESETDSPETTEPAGTAASDEVPACTDETPVVSLYGEFTKAQVKEGILLTNVGQSADAATMAALLNKANAVYNENDAATAADLSGYGTLIVVAGASTKGLGSAGISQEDEMNRAKELLAAADAAGMTIVLAHLGGTGRRGNTSDLFIEVCMAYADYMLVVEEGNSDGYFSDYCKANNVPLTLIKNSKSGAATVADLFA